MLPLASQLLSSSPHDTSFQHLLMQKQLQQTAPLTLPFGHQIEPSWLEAMKAAEPSVNSLPTLPLSSSQKLCWAVKKNSVSSLMHLISAQRLQYNKPNITMIDKDYTLPRHTKQVLIAAL